jgi:hypothetical protein
MSQYSAGSPSRTSQSKLFERYDVELPTVSSSDATKSRWRGWFKNEHDETRRQQQQQLPLDQWTNIEMIKYLIKNSSLKSKLIAILAIVILFSIIKSTFLFRNDANSNDDVGMTRGPIMTKYGLRPDKMDPDSHMRSNPFAPAGHQSYMEGVLEVKRVKKRDDPQPPPPPMPQQSLQLQDESVQTQGKILSHEARKKTTPGKRGKGRKLPSESDIE